MYFFKRSRLLKATFSRHVDTLIATEMLSMYALLIMKHVVYVEQPACHHISHTNGRIPHYVTTAAWWDLTTAKDRDKLQRVPVKSNSHAWVINSTREHCRFRSHSSWMHIVFLKNPRRPVSVSDRVKGPRNRLKA